MATLKPRHNLQSTSKHHLLRRPRFCVAGIIIEGRMKSGWLIVIADLIAGHCSPRSAISRYTIAARCQRDCEFPTTRRDDSFSSGRHAKKKRKKERRERKRREEKNVGIRGLNDVSNRRHVHVRGGEKKPMSVCVSGRGECRKMIYHRDFG